MTPRRTLVLASTSRYRRELLGRLRVPFECDRPEIDESPLPGESPALLDTRTGRADVRCVPCRVNFRTLGPALIEAYLRAEEPYDCAGSAKSEGLGIALIERMDTSDPTSLVGLPLIELCAMLAAAGEPVLPAW